MSVDHPHSGNKKTLLIAFLITTVYMVAEAIGGYLTNSLAWIGPYKIQMRDSLEYRQCPDSALYAVLRESVIFFMASQKASEPVLFGFY